jgi:hypothetical protein
VPSLLAGLAVVRRCQASVWAKLRPASQGGVKRRRPAHGPSPPAAAAPGCAMLLWPAGRRSHASGRLLGVACPVAAAPGAPASARPPRCARPMRHLRLLHHLHREDCSSPRCVSRNHRYRAMTSSTAKATSQLCGVMITIAAVLRIAPAAASAEGLIIAYDQSQLLHLSPRQSGDRRHLRADRQSAGDHGQDRRHRQHHRATRGTIDGKERPAVTGAWARRSTRAARRAQEKSL